MRSVASKRHRPYILADSIKSSDQSKSTLNRMTTSGHSFTGRTDVNYIARCVRGSRRLVKGRYRNRCAHLPVGVYTLRGD